MNFRRVRTLVYLGALVLPGVIYSMTAAQTKSPALCSPAGISQLSADGTAPPPTLPPKKPGTKSFA